MDSGTAALIVAAIGTGWSVIQWIKNRGKHKADTIKTLLESVEKLSEQGADCHDRIGVLEADVNKWRGEYHKLEQRIEELTLELERNEAAFIFVVSKIRDSQPIVVRDAMKIRRGESIQPNS